MCYKIPTGEEKKKDGSIQLDFQTDPNWERLWVFFVTNILGGTKDTKLKCNFDIFFAFV